MLLLLAILPLTSATLVINLEANPCQSLNKISVSGIDERLIHSNDQEKLNLTNYELIDAVTSKFGVRPTEVSLHGNKPLAKTLKVVNTRLIRVSTEPVLFTQHFSNSNKYPIIINTGAKKKQNTFLKRLIGDEKTAKTFVDYCLHFDCRRVIDNQFKFRAQLGKNVEVPINVVIGGMSGVKYLLPPGKSVNATTEVNKVVSRYEITFENELSGNVEATFDTGKRYIDIMDILNVMGRKTKTNFTELIKVTHYANALVTIKDVKKSITVLSLAYPLAARVSDDQGDLGGDDYSQSAIHIDIATAETLDDVKMSTNGHIVRKLSETGLKFFGISDEKLKMAILKYMGVYPSHVYLSSPPESPDMYGQFGWNEVLKIINPSHIAIKSFSVRSTVLLNQFNASLIKHTTALVSNSWSYVHNWMEDELISYQLELQGLPDDKILEYKSACAENSTLLKVINLESVLKKNTYGKIGRLHADRVTMEVAVKYIATLRGDVSIFDDKHRFLFAVDLTSLLSVLGQNSMKYLEEVITIDYFANPRIEYSNPNVVSHDNTDEITQIWL